MKVLGIETSCDETAAAVIDFDGHNYTLLSNTVASSMDMHILYGGVVPEIAARSHIEHINPVIDSALKSAFPAANDPWESIDAIAVTQGPGLGGSLLVGLTSARTLSIIKKKPLYPVNHVMAHPFAAFINQTAKNSLLENLELPDKMPDFPMLTLIVSGGHSQLVMFQSATDYEVLGKSRDDAVGEAFDKVAKIIGVPYPGGPNVANKATEGDAKAFTLPTARLEDGKYDTSYSGLKTAVLRAAQNAIGEDYRFPSIGLPERLSEPQKADLAASFQYAALKVLVDKTVLAFREFQPRSVVVAGGVAANSELRRLLGDSLPIPPTYPDIKLCTDNGAMIAALGCQLIQAQVPPTDPYSIDIKPTWPM